MKKLLCVVMAFLMAFFGAVTVTFASDGNELLISRQHISHEVSDKLYGITLDDSSFACDGGLSANLVNNGSFENEENPETAWSFERIESVVSTSKPMSAGNPTYETLRVDGNGVIRNTGYTELYDYKTREINETSLRTADMGFIEGEKYDFSCYVRNVDFDGTISVYLDSAGNDDVSVQLVTDNISAARWTKLTATLTASASEDGGLAIALSGNGSVSIDFISLVPQSSYGYGTSEWKNTTLRADLVSAIKYLKPAFIRFGSKIKALSWKNTIGDLSERLQFSDYADDGDSVPRTYTMAVGFHEYFQLCDDLGAKPIPVLSGGQGISAGSDELTNYAQDVLDLIEYANGDSRTTYWGALRSLNGHSDPFNLEYIELADEGSSDSANADAIRRLIHEKYPDILVIVLSENGAAASEVISDKHFSAEGNALAKRGKELDSYSRDGMQFIVGEYACDSSGIGSMITDNNIFAAVQEAAFMTALERNSDAVKMSAYSPTISKLNANDGNTSLVWIDSQSIVLTPSYYNQLLFSNNTGDEYIDTAFPSDFNEEIYQSVTVDEDSGIVYVKLVNTGSSTESVTLRLDGFDGISHASVQSIQNGFKSASNEFGSQTVAPAQEELEFTDNSVDVDISAYSVNVVRLVYGDGNAGGLYQLPEELDLTTSSFVPTIVKVAIAVISVAFFAGIAGGYIIYRKIIRKKGRKSNG